MRTSIRKFADSAKNRRLQLVVASGLVCFSPVAGALADEISQDIATPVVVTSDREGSVLVSSKKSASDEPAALAEMSEPTLAATPEVAEPTDEQVIKVANNSSVVEQEQNQDDDTAKSEGPQPAMFHGIQPGVSTKKELIKAWGEPKSTDKTESGELLSFHLDNFRGVDVLVEKDVVTLMKIALGRPETADNLADKVKADPLEAVEIVGPDQKTVAAIAYPERGIVMVLDSSDSIVPDTKATVSQMILQPLDAQTFCLRAQSHDHSKVSARLADLQQAAAIDSNDAETQFLLGKLYLELGRATEAQLAAKRALDIERENPIYRLQWAECLTATGNYDTAVVETRKVLDLEGLPEMVRAKALHQMGTLASLGDAEIADKAIDFHNMAIQLADKLATNDDKATRREAKMLLIDAHMAIAVEVSRRDYDDKMETVADWVSRASGFAEEMIASGEAGLEVRALVAQQSLAALANFKPAKDPQPLIDEIFNTIQQIEEGEDVDPMWIDELHWSTGIACLHVVQINHHRGETKLALDYADRAVEMLAAGVEQRRDAPGTQRLVGQLYFHIGALHAVHNKDHEEAVAWYDKATPLLTAESIKTELFVPRREGEALVSMAVSYWNEGDKRRALELTEMGAELIEEAVAGKVIPDETLAVPYNNLSAMHKMLGNTEASEKYSKMVKEVTDRVKEQKQAKAENPAPKKPTQNSGVTNNTPTTQPRTASRPQPRVRHQQPPTAQKRSGGTAGRSTRRY